MPLDPPSPLLAIPEARIDRWDLIHQVIGQWFPPDRRKLRLPPGMAPISSPPTACPALLEWHAIVRESPGIWCRQDHLFCGSGDWRRGDYLTIAVENQACAYWGVPLSELDQGDPPVLLDSLANGQWVLENTTMSEFALTWLASSIKWSQHNRGWANGPVNEVALQLVIDCLPRLGLADWSWPEMPTRFYGTKDLLVEVNGDRGYVWLWASARTKAAFAEFKELVAPALAEWSASSDEWPDGWVSAPEDLP